MLGCLTNALDRSLSRSLLSNDVPANSANFSRLKYPCVQSHNHSSDIFSADSFAIHNASLMVITCHVCNLPSNKGSRFSGKGFSRKIILTVYSDKGWSFIVPKCQGMSSGLLLFRNVEIIFFIVSKEATFALISATRPLFHSPSFLCSICVFGPKNIVRDLLFHFGHMRLRDPFRFIPYIPSFSVVYTQYITSILYCLHLHW